MAKLVPVLLCISLLASGCALRGDGRNFAYTIDGAMVAVGAGALAKTSSTDCPDDLSGLGCDLDMIALTGIGLALVAAGLLGLAMNYGVNHDLEVAAEPSFGLAPGAQATAPVALPPDCGAAIRAFDRADDPVERDKRYAAMRPNCRAILAARAGRDATTDSQRW